MNYLETGLPHTEFFIKKSSFKPPRFIPLCSLGRKYLGLEPLTKKELNILITRLSEPKKSLEIHDEAPATKEPQPQTLGSSRFVGQKKMTSFQIEKMVARLYSKRTTKDVIAVDEPVESNDPINMTDRQSDDSDTEDHVKIKKEQDNSNQKSQTCEVSQKGFGKDFSIKRECIGPHKRQEQNNEIEDKNNNVEKTMKEKTEVLRLKTNFKCKCVQENDTADSKGKKRESIHIERCASRQGSSLAKKSKTYNIRCSNISKHEIIKKQNIDETKSIPTYFTVTKCKSESALSKRGNIENLADSGINETLKSARTDLASRLSPEVTKLCTNRLQAVYGASNTDTSKCSKSEISCNSPLQKMFKAEDNKASRFTVPPCDKLLIDRVATCNRSPRARYK